METRMSRDEYFMKIAELTSLRSTCLRKKVGAIAVKQKRIIMSGYNGSVSGSKHCLDVGCLMFENHCIRTIHAELNIITQSAKAGVNLADATIYCTVEPCYNCLNAMISCGIKTVKYKEKRYDERFLLNQELYTLIEVEQIG